MLCLFCPKCGIIRTLCGDNAGFWVLTDTLLLLIFNETAREKVVRDIVILLYRFENIFVALCVFDVWLVLSGDNTLRGGNHHKL
jgi:hypothetical protein